MARPKKYNKSRSKLSGCTISLGTEARIHALNKKGYSTGEALDILVNFSYAQQARFDLFLETLEEFESDVENLETHEFINMFLTQTYKRGELL